MDVHISNIDIHFGFSIIIVGKDDTFEKKCKKKKMRQIQSRIIGRDYYFFLYLFPAFSKLFF